MPHASVKVESSYFRANVSLLVSYPNLSPNPNPNPNGTRTVYVRRVQVLVCPGLHYGLAPPDMFEYFEGADHANPLVNPAAADRHTLRSLPPTLVLTAGDDQWEGE